MRGLQAALTRVPYSADCTDQRLGLPASLHAYTAGGAWAAHMDGFTGTIAKGMAADLVLVDGDVGALAPEAFGTTGIALTVCGGRITHAAEGFA